MPKMWTTTSSEASMNPPPILKRLIGQLESQGYKHSDAITIAITKQPSPNHNI